MKLESQPLVSVITPVHNCEKFLRECIESVLAQTYTNWEYIIVNNCSTDRTPEIVRMYERKDGRIRMHSNEKLLGIARNHNHALTLISPDSRYCKFLHADDWLFPECLERMVEVAERYPSVGIVGSYRLDDTKVNCDGLPYPSHIISGREICRLTFLKGLYTFGSPSTVLFRSQLIRGKAPFFNEENVHFDKEACFDVLQHSDYGFVHQVLSFTRRENETNTTFARRLNTYILGDLVILKKYGPFYLGRDEYSELLKRHLRNYCNVVAKGIFEARGREFRKFHSKGLRELGYPLSPVKVAGTIVSLLYNRVLEGLKIRK